jgi:uncharacterized protein (DUF736 family)
MRLALALVLTGLVAGQAAAANAPIARHNAKDTGLARRALIGKADVGKGWQAVKAAAGRSTLTCKASEPSMAGIVETGTARTGFRGGAQLVAQVAWVFRSRAQAATLWRRAAGKSFLACRVDRARAAGGLPVTKLESGELAVPKLAQRTVAYRVIATAKVKGQTVKLYYDDVLLMQGRTVTQLTFAGGRPIPSAVELALARVVAGRLGSPGVA